MIKIYTNGNLSKETMSKITDLDYELSSVDKCDLIIIMTDRIIELETNEDILLDWNKRIPVVVCVKTIENNEDEICKFLIGYEVSTGVDCFTEYKSGLVELVKSIIRRELINCGK